MILSWRSLPLYLLLVHLTSCAVAVKPKPHPRPPDANTTASVELIDELSTSTSVWNANFGQSLAVSGEVVAVSAHALDAGSVFVYSFTEETVTQSIKLSPAESDVYSFGQGVALSDSSLFATALRRPCITCNDTDSDAHALVYHYSSISPASWTLSNTIEIARRNESAGILSMSVCGSESALLVSVLSGSTDEITEATLELHSQDSVVDVQALITSYGAAWQGGDVAIYENTILVGDTSSSAAYIITKPNMSYAITAVLSGQSGDFGHAVALSGSYAVIAAPTYSGYGAVFVYNVAENYALAATLIGYSLALSGNTIFVGAPGTFNYDVQNGAVFQFELVDEEWVEVQRYSSVYESAALGVTLAASDAVVLMTVQKATFGSETQRHNSSVHYLIADSSEDDDDAWFNDDAEHHKSNSEVDAFFSKAVNIVVAAVLLFAVPGTIIGGVWVYRYHKDWLGIKTDTVSGPSLEIPPLPVPSSSDSEAGSPALTTASSLFAKLRALRVSTHPMFEMHSPQQEQKNPMSQPAVQC